MTRLNRMSTSVLLLVLLGWVQPLCSQDSKKHPHSNGAAAELPAVLWRHPQNIPAMNLFYGSGGRDHAPDPSGTYNFVKEDSSGTSAKFDIQDANGVEWRGKRGRGTPSAKATTR